MSHLQRQGPAVEVEDYIGEPTEDSQYWAEVAKSLTPDKSLARMVEHQKSVLSTVSTVGTLLTGLGAVTAAVAVDRTTYTTDIPLLFGTLEDVPVVPVGALLAATLASAAVMVALFARRAQFFKVNPGLLNEVQAWYETEMDRGALATRVASWLLLAAAGVAALTALVSGLVVVADEPPEPVNQATLVSSTGKESATFTLGGTIAGVDENQVVQVKVEAMAPTKATPAVLANYVAYPDEDGNVALDGTFTPVPAENSARATVTIHDWTSVRGKQVIDDDAQMTYELVASAPWAPPAKPTTPAKSKTKKQKNG